MGTAFVNWLIWPVLLDLHSAALVQQLGDERFLVREAASAALVKLVCSEGGHQLVPRLEAATRHPDLEVAHRASRVLTEFYNIRPSNYPLIPWIDMLPQVVKNRDDVIKEYRHRAHKQGCSPYAPQWYDYRLATSLHARDLLRAGRSRAEVQQMLDDMVAGERRYKASRGLPDDY